MIFGRVGNAMIGVRARYALSFVPFSESNKEGNRDDMLQRGSVGNVLLYKFEKEYSRFLQITQRDDEPRN